MAPKVELDRAKLLRLYREGKNTEELGVIFGCSQFPIQRILREEGALRRPGRRRGVAKWHCQDRRTAFLINIKIGRECTDCSLRCDIGNYPVFEWDHVGEKNFEIAAAWNRRNTEQDILNEISLCEIVCANCHRMRTHARRISNVTG